MNQAIDLKKKFATMADDARKQLDELERQEDDMQADQGGDNEGMHHADHGSIRTYVIDDSDDDDVVFVAQTSPTSVLRNVNTQQPPNDAGNSVTCPSGHVLANLGVSTGDGWACDQRKSSDGCRRGCTDFWQSSDWGRHRCAHCDYDLCDLCHDEQANAAKLLSTAKQSLPGGPRTETTGAFAELTRDAMQVVLKAKGLTQRGTRGECVKRLIQASEQTKGVVAPSLSRVQPNVPKGFTMAAQTKAARPRHCLGLAAAAPTQLRDDISGSDVVLRKNQCAQKLYRLAFAKKAGETHISASDVVGPGHVRSEVSEVSEAEPTLHSSGSSASSSSASARPHPTTSPADGAASSDKVSGQSTEPPQQCRRWGPTSHPSAPSEVYGNIHTATPNGAPVFIPAVVSLSSSQKAIECGQTTDSLQQRHTKMDPTSGNAARAPATNTSLLPVLKWSSAQHQHHQQQQQQHHHHHQHHQQQQHQHYHLLQQQHHHHHHHHQSAWVQPMGLGLGLGLGLDPGMGPAINFNPLTHYNAYARVLMRHNGGNIPMAMAQPMSGNYTGPFGVPGPVSAFEQPNDPALPVHASSTPTQTSLVGLEGLSARLTVERPPTHPAVASMYAPPGPSPWLP